MDNVYSEHNLLNQKFRLDRKSRLLVDALLQRPLILFLIAKKSSFDI